MGQALEEALAGAPPDPPDVLFLAWGMPVMDGLAVLAALQPAPRLRAPPIVFLVGAPRATPAGPGVTPALGKPFRFAVHEERLRAILHSRPPFGTARDPPSPR